MQRSLPEQGVAHWPVDPSSPPPPPPPGSVLASGSLPESCVGGRVQLAASTAATRMRLGASVERRRGRAPGATACMKVSPPATCSDRQETVEQRKCHGRNPNAPPPDAPPPGAPLRGCHPRLTTRLRHSSRRTTPEGFDLVRRS